MTSFSTLLRGRARPARPPGPKKAVFVSYGSFDCNSAGHIAGFAAELSRQGLAVGVCARDRITSVHAFGDPAFAFSTLAELGADPQRIIGFDGAFEPASTVIIAWTPRKAVRRPLAKIAARHGLPYLVHFEDNEEHLSALRFGEASEGKAAAAQDRAEREALLAGAAGATVIEERLKELLPTDLPALLLEPGVDLELFGAPLPPWRRASVLRAVGAPEDAAVLVYPGNIHRANLAEVSELYRAVARLRQAGRDLVLIKTGKDDVPVAESIGFDPADAGVIAVGMMERPFLIDLIKCADLFVQPGAPGPFNDYRLPSKIPEFMAVGRPIILPATNVGRRLADGQEALLLRTGAAEEIAARIEAVLADPALAARLGHGARAFAERTYVWERQGRKLMDFLVQTQAARP
jgi:glycosyltransferase involved in cell wall biosynthesis